LLRSAQRAAFARRTSFTVKLDLWASEFVAAEHVHSLLAIDSEQREVGMPSTRTVKPRVSAHYDRPQRQQVGARWASPHRIHIRVRMGPLAAG